MARENTVDTTSPEILVSDAKHALAAALDAADSVLECDGPFDRIIWGLETAQSKLDELAEQLEEGSE